MSKETILSNKRRKEFLHECEVYENLSFKKLFTFVYRSIFNSKKINEFYNGLHRGKSAVGSFIDAKDL